MEELGKGKARLNKRRVAILVFAGILLLLTVFAAVSGNAVA